MDAKTCGHMRKSVLSLAESILSTNFSYELSHMHKSFPNFRRELRVHTNLVALNYLTKVIGCKPAHSWELFYYTFMHLRMVFASISQNKNIWGHWLFSHDLQYRSHCNICNELTDYGGCFFQIMASHLSKNLLYWLLKSWTEFVLTPKHRFQKQWNSHIIVKSVKSSPVQSSQVKSFKWWFSQNQMKLVIFFPSQPYFFLLLNNWFPDLPIPLSTVGGDFLEMLLHWSILFSDSSKTVNTVNYDKLYYKKKKKTDHKHRGTTRKTTIYCQTLRIIFIHA